MAKSHLPAHRQDSEETLLLKAAQIVAAEGIEALSPGIDIAPGQRPKLERLCRYVSRPPVATERMALTGPHTATERRTS